MREELSIEEFIKQMPKAELHLHIEGSFEPELMFKIAKRNKISIPFKNIDEIHEAYNFSNLQDFLDIYYQGAGVLINEEDFYDLTIAYFKKISEDNVTHTEIMFDPQAHTDRGIPFDTVFNGIYNAVQDAEKKFNISCNLIMSYLRHLDEDSAFKTLSQGKKYVEKITAVGLDSSEIGNPPSKFKNVYRASISEGFLPVAHAGEEGPAEYIREALDILNIVRIDHGNRALEDKKLVDRIISEDKALTVCPLSNLELCVVKDLRDHPIKKMLDLGLKATISSDDPAYFGGYMNDNFLATQKALNLNKNDIYTLNKNAFENSFLDENTKKKKLTDLENFINYKNT